MINAFKALLLCSLFFIAAAVSAQDEGAPASAEATQAADGVATAPAVDEEAVDDAESDIDDSDLDEQTYEQDEDDFTPSEEVPADEPIPFPTNI